MLSNIILVGQKIEIQLINMKKSKTFEQEKVHISKVAEILDEETLEITMPIEKSKIVLLEPDLDYNLFFYTIKGVYLARGTIIGRYKTGTLYLLKIKLISSIEKHQRREYFRYACSIHFLSRKLTELEVSKVDLSKVKIGKENLIKGLIIDISGGGLKLISQKYYEEGDLCICNIPLEIGGNIQEIIFVGVILNTIELERNRGKYEHTLKFKEISAVNREHIIQYIFKKEREKRKNEMGR